jgi:formamidopyrimidine-DNA glycosylase
MSKYKHAIVKFNGGRGALLCNQCSVIIDYGFKHKDVEHYCENCQKLLRELPEKEESE